MVATRSRKGTVNLEIPKSKPPPPVSVAKDDGYERCRDQRIRENLERMQQLGLADLASKLKSEHQISRTTKRSFIKRTPLLLHSVSRRSSRLQNSSPICYDESDVHVRVKKSRSGKGSMGSIVEMVCEDEIYTEEHEKMLGSCETHWTLFVDGCGSNGRRIYDQIKGMTCHQCRQKTLGHHTHCSRCEIVQGQFCGDCLYMRYGENVLEANKNPDWICPVCRGICNCSICRSKKNWPPTGSLYRKIFNLGYKSVAHYLIKTRRAKVISEKPTSESPIKENKELSMTVVKKSPQSGEILLLENSVGIPLLQPENSHTEADPHQVTKSNAIEIVKIGESSESHDGSSDLVIPLNIDGNKQQNSLPEKQLGRKKGRKPKSFYANFTPSPDSVAGRLRKRHQQNLP